MSTHTAISRDGAAQPCTLTKEQWERQEEKKQDVHRVRFQEDTTGKRHA